MTKEEKLRMCAGCRDDFYNDHNPIGVKECWMLKDAEPVMRWRIDWWTRPDKPGAFTLVQTLPCHNAPGQYSHYVNLPVFAVDPVRPAKDTVVAR